MSGSQSSPSRPVISMLFTHIGLGARSTFTAAAGNIIEPCVRSPYRRVHRRRLELFSGEAVEHCSQRCLINT